jgi:hypothetical protein
MMCLLSGDYIKSVADATVDTVRAVEVAVAVFDDGVAGGGDEGATIGSALMPGTLQ